MNTRLASESDSSALLTRGRLTNGLVWGFDFIGSEALPVDDPHSVDRPAAGGLRWLHFSSADRGSQRWIESAHLPKPVQDLMLSNDDHHFALVDGGYVACVLHDFERKFDGQDTPSVGTLRFAVGDGFMLTLRKHPLRCADVIRRRIEEGARPVDAPMALELLAGAIAEVMSGVLGHIEAAAERVEDELLTDDLSPDTSELVGMRRRSVRMHRMLAGLGAACRRLESDAELPQTLLPAIENFAQRIIALDQRVTALQSQLRLLRDELDLQAAQRTNRSLYVLSILSALMLPATLVTGLFGMNTGGLPWATSSFGTLAASLSAFSSAAAVYWVLRRLGFVRL
jgi:Mg2+ and Co2+ transporter CorA